MYEKLIVKTLTPIEKEYTILTFSDEEADEASDYLEEHFAPAPYGVNAVRVAVISKPNKIEYYVDDSTYYVTDETMHDLLAWYQDRFFVVENH